eukprot:22413-Amphidinium_carterae.1
MQQCTCVDSTLAAEFVFWPESSNAHHMFKFSIFTFPPDEPLGTIQSRCLSYSSLLMSFRFNVRLTVDAFFC